MKTIEQIVVQKREDRKKRKAKKLLAHVQLVALNEADKEEKRIKMRNNVLKEDSTDTSDSNEDIEQNAVEDSQNWINPKRKRGSDGEGSSLTKKLKREYINPTEAHTCSAEELRKYKILLRERDQQRKDVPICYLLEPGRSSQLCVPPKKRSPLLMEDVQQLLMHSLVSYRSNPPRWCKLLRSSRISHIVCVVVEGIGVDDYLAYQDTLSKVMNTFDFQVELLHPGKYGSSVIEELSNVPPNTNREREDVDATFTSYRSAFPISKHQTSKRRKKEICKGDQEDKKEGCTRNQLLLSFTDMIMEGYPIQYPGKLGETYKDYIFTQDRYDTVTEESPLFGLDCEMCITEANKHELTRISIVDEGHNTLYDELVKPDNKITNYLTKISGINKKMLEGVKTKLEDVQTAIRKMLPTDAILVGQSLNFDLDALQMMHPFVIDTSCIFNLSGCRSKKAKLAALSQVFLNETIQDDSSGHDSCQDSLASLKLVQLKMEKGLSYGDAVVGGYIPNVPNPPQREKTLTSSILGLIERRKKSGAMVTHESLANRYRKSLQLPEQNVFVVSNNKAVTKTACHKTLLHDLTVIGLDMTNETLQETHMKKLDKRLSRIYNHTYNKSLMAVILSGTASQNGVCLVRIKPDPS